MPTNGIQKITLLILLSLTAESVLANNTATPAKQDQDGWQFEVAPYLWALNMNGTVKIGPIKTNIDQSFGDLLAHLNWGEMLWIDAKKDRFGIFGNVLYASSSVNTSYDTLPIKAKNDFGIYSAGISYRVYQAACLASYNDSQSSTLFAIDPYVGFRYTANRASLTVDSPLGSLRVANNQNWTDPIIGARFEFDFTKAWLVTLAGDIGGTNASSDYSYNLIGLLGFKPQTMWTSTAWYLGYRLLDQHYITGHGENYFNWDVKLFGPMAGVSFTF